MGYFSIDEEKSREYKDGLFPNEGMSLEEIKSLIDELYNLDLDQNKGHIMLYSLTLMDHHEVTEAARYAFMKFFKKNSLFKGLLPSVAKMEEDVKQMVVEILNGGKDARAIITAGGSESIFCALNAARQRAKEQHPEIKEPEIVVPYSVHPAFSKWCHYTGMKINRVQLGSDKRADVNAMEKAIGSNTIALVGSAPCWPYGLYDPIDELAEVSEKHGLWMHIDACVGGFLAPWIEKLGNTLPPHDFRVPGVMSISADLHKYGYTAKPCSTVLFRDEDLLKYHQFDVNDWPCGKYSSEGILGSRPAAGVASAWAVLNYLGEEGYLALTRRHLEVRDRYIQGINSIESFNCWNNDLAPLVFETGNLDTFVVLAGLMKEGIYVFPIIDPPLIQISIDPVTDEVIDGFLETLKEVAEQVREGSLTMELLSRYIPKGFKKLESIIK